MPKQLHTLESIHKARKAISGSDDRAIDARYRLAKRAVAIPAKDLHELSIHIDHLVEMVDPDTDETLLGTLVRTIQASVRAMKEGR